MTTPLVRIPRYVKHPLFSDATHAMKRGSTVLVDRRAFLYAEAVFADAVYPDEPASPHGRDRDALVTATFAKGGTCFYVDTQASALAHVFGRENVPEEWFGR